MVNLRKIHTKSWPGLPFRCIKGEKGLNEFRNQANFSAATGK